MSGEITHYFPASRSREIRDCLLAGHAALLAEASSDELGAHIQLTFSDGSQFLSHGMDGERRRSQVMDEIAKGLKRLGNPARQISPDEDQDFWRKWIDCARNMKPSEKTDEGAISPADIRLFNEVALPNLEEKLLAASGKSPPKLLLYALRDFLGDVIVDFRLIAELAQRLAVSPPAAAPPDIVEWPDLSAYGMALRIVRLSSGSHYLAVANGDRQPEELRKLGYNPIPNNKSGMWYKPNVNVGREAFAAHLPKTTFPAVSQDSVIVRLASGGPGPRPGTADMRMDVARPATA